MDSLDEGPSKVVAGGTVVDDVEAELDVDSTGPPTKVGLRPDMSTLSSLNIPGAPDSLQAGASVHHAQR